MTRKALEKSTGAGRLYVAKNRAGRDGLVFPIHINTATSRIDVLDETSLTLNEAVHQDENEMNSVDESSNNEGDDEEDKETKLAEANDAYENWLAYVEQREEYER